MNIHYILHKKIISYENHYEYGTVEPPIKKPYGDWVDLRAAATVNFKKGEYKKIPLGLSVILPKGHGAVIAPRSSLFEKTGLICPNSIGIIDNSYCGKNDEWNFPAYATRDTKIEFNQRICQFIVYPSVWEARFFESPELFEGLENRGGIGSTGNF